MFKRLSELDHSAHKLRSAAPPSKSMSDLQTLINGTFSDIKDDANLCDLFVQTTITTVDPNGLMTSVLATIEKDFGRDFQFERFLSWLTSQKTSRPIFVLGNVGIGKSTLLYYFFKCLLQDKHDRILPVFVDFKDVNDDPNYISTFVTNEIDSILTKRLDSNNDPEVVEKVLFFCMPARKTQLDNLSRVNPVAGEVAKYAAITRLQENKEDWNQTRIRYLQECLGISVCLIFDNVDHHWTSGFIQNAITEAMAREHRYQCRLLMTLRPYNFGLAYERGAYAAHPFTVITLDKPDLRTLLERRIDTTLKKCHASGPAELILNNGARMTPEDFLHLLKIMLGSLLTLSVSNLLLGIAGTNFRKLLACTRYIFNQKTLAAIGEPWRSSLSMYDALESILRPEGLEYKSPEIDSRAIIVNVFEDGSPSQPGNSLIRVRVLQAVYRYGERAFHSDVLKDLRLMGYDEKRVDLVLDLFHNFGLIEYGDSSGLLASVDPTPYCHKLTSSGHYYLETLMYEYRYAQAIKEATYFPETKFRKITGPGIEVDRSLEERAAEVDAFDEYIADEEREEAKRCEDPLLLQSAFYRIAVRLKSKHQRAVRGLRAAHDRRSQENAAARESQHNPQGD